MIAKTKTIHIDPQIMIYWKDLLKCQENRAESLGVSSKDWKLSLLLNFSSLSRDTGFLLTWASIFTSAPISILSNGSSQVSLKYPSYFGSFSFTFLSTISIYFYMIWQSNPQIKFNFSRKIIWKAQCMLWVKSTLCQISILRQ